MDKEFSIAELSSMADISMRTIRFYVQQGLVSNPVGEKRGARYNKHHLDQLLSIKKWQAAGLSLERIRELLASPKEGDVPLRPRWPGMIEVWSHLHIADGVELHIEPNRAGLSPEELRAFFKQVMESYHLKIKEKN